MPDGEPDLDYLRRVDDVAREYLLRQERQKRGAEPRDAAAAWWQPLRMEIQACCAGAEATSTPTRRLLDHFRTVEHLCRLVSPIVSVAAVYERVHDLDQLRVASPPAEVVVGWRVLRCSPRTPNAWRLEGTLGVPVVSVLSPEAQCDRQFAHEAPELNCRCGYYLTRQPASIRAMDCGHLWASVLTLTLALGKTVEHERGWRTHRVRYLMAWAPPSAGPTLDQLGIRAFWQNGLGSIVGQLDRDLEAMVDPELAPYARLALERLHESP